MSDVNIGVIGAGQIGTHHVTNYMEIEGVNVVAVCDFDEKNLGKAMVDTAHKTGKMLRIQLSTLYQEETRAARALFDTGIYQIAQLLYLIGTPKVERISGKTYQETPIDEKRKSESGYSVEEMDAVFNLDSMSFRWHRLYADEMYLDFSQLHWIGALQGAMSLLPTAEIALQTMLIREGIYLSDELGREVTADEVGDKSISKASEL